MRMLYRFIYLNTWSPIGGTVWDGLGGVIVEGSMSPREGFER